MSHGNRSENETLDRLMHQLSEQEAVGDLPSSELPELEGLPLGGDATGTPMQLGREVLDNVRLRVRVELGRTRMPLGSALALSSGSLVELDRTTGEPVDILVSDVPIARGQVLIVDGKFCIRVTEVLAADRLSQAADELASS